MKQKILTEIAMIASFLVGIFASAIFLFILFMFATKYYYDRADSNQRIINENTFEKYYELQKKQPK